MEIQGAIVKFLILFKMKQILLCGGGLNIDSEFVNRS